jgi:mono/diheme cytochrome c family protein
MTAMRNTPCFVGLFTVSALLALTPGCEGDDPTAPPPEDDVIVDGPSAQSVHSSKVRPPAISGGTLAVAHDLGIAVVSDPDRDRVLFVDLESNLPSHELALEPGDEPGRVIVDGAGRAHVALRNTHHIVTVNVATGELLSRRSVCNAPRGLASFRAVDDPTDDTLLVTCATGELVELEAAPDGAELARVELEPDLRDVVLTGNGTRAGRKVLVSSFRSADVLALGADLTFAGRSRPVGYTHQFTGRAFTSNVAWRMVPSMAGGAVMLHQRSATVPIGDANQQVPQQYYASLDCGSSVVHGSATEFDENGEVLTSNLGVGLAVLPVDLAVNPAGTDFASVAAGSGFVEVTSLEFPPADPCLGGASSFRINAGPEPIAVAYVADDEILVQLREPSTLLRYQVTSASFNFSHLATIDLGGESRRDTGHQMFHGNPDGLTSISCASCHPEGGDDAHVWQFTDIGSRRTQTLQGDITNTAPFHWDGDLEDLDHLMSKVFVERMGGQEQSPERVSAMKEWMRGIPRIPGPDVVDEAAVARGKALYENDALACSSCHGGDALTNNETVDVGTGRAFQVPTLMGIRNRAPYMHDGCAKTLHDRFDPECGGTAHGDLTGLTDGDVDDLVAYMNTL